MGGPGVPAPSDGPTLRAGSASGAAAQEEQLLDSRDKRDAAPASLGLQVCGGNAAAATTREQRSFHDAAAADREGRLPDGAGRATVRAARDRGEGRRQLRRHHRQARGQAGRARLGVARVLEAIPIAGGVQHRTVDVQAILGRSADRRRA